MDKLQKKGDSYIKYDDNNNPEYGFVVDGLDIIKFVSFSDDEHDKIVLPDVAEKSIFCSKDLGENYYILMSPKEKKKYIMGNVRICEGCFSGFDNFEVVVPFDNSILIDPYAFDVSANVTLNLPKNLELKQVEAKSNLPNVVKKDKLLVVADKKFTTKFGVGGYTFNVGKFSDGEFMPYQPIFNIKHNVELETEEENEK